MVTEENILRALGKIIDPDFNKDIVSLGFVKNIKIFGSNVSLDIELTTPACPVKDEFQKKAQEAIRGVNGVQNVDVNMRSQPIKRANVAPDLPNVLAKVKSIIAVSSCKGGVGKSTIAACLAKELSQRGFKVGLVDADIHGPSVPTLFDLHNIPIYTNENKLLIPVEVDGLKLMSFGFLLGDAPAVMRGPIVSRYIQQLLHQTDWGELDYLFVDMPPGTGDVQLTITQSVQLSGAVIVTTRQTLSLVDVARGILMFEKVDVPILGIIENMSYFICDACQKKHYIFGGDKGGTLEERFGLETLAELPIIPELSGKLSGPIHNEFITKATDRVVMAIGKNSIAMKAIPAIKFDDKTVTLIWPDGSKVQVENRDLRLSCRCAQCMDELTGQKILEEDKIRKDIAPKEIFSLGNYAIGVIWNDGHSSGIYPYKNILALAGQTSGD